MGNKNTKTKQNYQNLTAKINRKTSTTKQQHNTTRNQRTPLQSQFHKRKYLEKQN